MKKNKNELDVDFIGGQTPLTKEEEKAISEYIKANKMKKAAQTIKKRKTAKKGKAIA